MAVLPASFLKSLQDVQGFDETSFERIHESGEQVTAIRINPNKILVDIQQSSIEGIASALRNSRLPFNRPVSWSSFGYYLSQRPSFTFDPLFHAGCYYVQDASSMFLEQALKQTVDLSQSLNALDLCAAPGGKSTHIQSLISADSLLVSNEVIKARAGILKQNIIKWGSENVVVTNNDPQHFQKLEGFFDVIIIDAPCSGSGLFRKDPEAIVEWSKENVALCCGRQRRIIADALPALKEDGVLVYSTCSYSEEEDEEIADWVVEEFKMKNEELKIEEGWGIVATKSKKTNAIGYRFFPDKVKGEGFYLACFRKVSGEGEKRYKEAKLEKPVAKEIAAMQPWLQADGLSFFKEHIIYALPTNLTARYSVVKQALNVQYAGVAIGEVMKDKLVPEHALTQSNRLSPTIAKVNVTYEEAIKYLQRADVALPTEAKGWQVVAYQDYNLGWINALSNRFNNYYPKELRILKQRDDSAF